MTFIDDLRNRIAEMVSVDSPEPVPDENVATGIDSATTVKAMRYPISHRMIESIFDNSAVMQTVIWNLKEKIFRRGIEIEANFSKKCGSCGKEFQYEAEKCDECGKKIMLDPSEIEKERLEAIFMGFNANSASESFLSVCKQMEQDLDLFDDAFLYLEKQYICPKIHSNLIVEKVKEVWRISPARIRIIADENDIIGNEHSTCIFHRKLFPIDTKHCPQCGRVTHPAEFMFVDEGGESEGVPLICGEVIHFSKFQPSRTYGIPPMVSLWRYCLAMIHMDHLQYDYYRLRRSPRGILVANTDNPASFEATWKKIQTKLKEDPLYIPAIGIRGRDNKRGLIEFVSFVDSLEEMKYIDVRDEMRQRISSFYGVSNIFMNDVKYSSGLGNETQQIVVTDQAIDSCVALWNRQLERVTEIMDIKDWKLTLLPPREEDEQKELEIKRMEIENARIMLEMGFDVELNEEGEFQFSGEAKQMGGADFGYPGFSMPETEETPEEEVDEVY